MPRRLRLFLRYGRLLRESLLLIAQVRLGLWFQGHEAVRSRFCRPALKSRLGLGPQHPDRRAGIDPVVWAVRNVARVVPGASCLTQAFAAQALLLRRDVVSTVRIGVRRSPRGRFQAHAWLLCDGRIALGADHEPGPDFVPLVDFAPVYA